MEKISVLNKDKLQAYSDYTDYVEFEELGGI